MCDLPNSALILLYKLTIDVRKKVVRISRKTSFLTSDVSILLTAFSADVLNSLQSFCRSSDLFDITACAANNLSYARSVAPVHA